jgi:hypothetical protein
MSRRPPLSVFLPFLTSVLLIAGLYVYHWASTSAQSRYYDERAFRVLALLGGAFAETTEGLRTVLGASTAKVGSTETYLQDVLPGYRIQDFEIAPFSAPKRDGVLRLWPLARSPAFPVRVRYAAATAASGSRSAMSECAKEEAGAICATVDLAPILDRLFDKLGDEFFDDVVIADATGKVWYQQNPKNNWIVDLAPLIAPAEKGRAAPSGAKDHDAESSSGAGSNSGSGSGSEAGGKSSTGKPAGHDDTSTNRRPPRVNFNMARDVELAGSAHRLYLAPLPVLLPDGETLGPAVIAGLYRGDDDRHAVGAPHTFLIWGTLAVLTTFTLLWPIVSIFNMGPKARMPRRHVAYLVASILASAALLTLLALNGSFTLSERSRTRDDLKTLATGITRRFSEEVLAAARLLHGADPAPFAALPVQPPTRSAPNESAPPSMRQQIRALDPAAIPGVRETPSLNERASYPYFDYLFWVDAQGWQRIKLTVPERATPQTRVDKEAYFLDIKNDDLATLPNPGKRGESYKLRMEPVYSPNTHEFFTIIAMASREPYFAKILATRLESLVDPVMPPGFGFAVVDATGHVKYHANSARNLQENFLTESQNDRALQALLSHRLEGTLWINYTGRPHAAVIRPFTDLTRTPLSLIVFRDTTPLGTVNASIVLVFALLMITWTIPFLLIAPIYMSRREYPLEAIWPCPEHRRYYAHLLVAQTAVLLVFVSTYSQSGPLACAIWWPMLLAYAGVVYPLLQFRFRPGLVTVASRVALIAALLALSAGSWAVVVPIVFAAASVPMLARRIESPLTKIPLKHLYASMALASLAVVIVAPACVLFKFAHDGIQRLEVAREEKRAVEAFRDRTRRIDAHFGGLHPEGLAVERHCASIDRYDSFLEVAAEETPEPLRFTALEARLPEFFGLFPPNALGAELQRIAIDGVRDPRPWAVTRTTLTYDPPDRDVDLLSITRRVEPWTGLRYSTTFALALVLVCLYLWFVCVARFVFLLDVQRVPQLDVWDPKTLPNANVLVLGQPRTGRRSAIGAHCEVEMLDLAELSAADQWAKVRIKGDYVCLFYFDFDLDNGETNTRKLMLLERLLYVGRVRVILLSSVDPMYYLGSRHGRDHGDPRSSPAAPPAPSELERWAAVLHRFEKVQLHPAPIADVDTSQWAYTATDDELAQKFLNDECQKHTALHRIGKHILSKVRTPIRNDEVLVEMMLDQADSYYRLLWTGCTANERLVLFQLARDGWTNPLNAAAIQQLERRGLVLRGRAPRIMNESFRRFVSKSQYPAEVARWETEERESVWHAIRLSLAVCLVVLATWSIYARPDVMTVMVAIVGGVGTLIATLMRVIGDLRAPSLVATSIRTGG